MPEFVTVRFLLLILCGITVVGFFFLHQTLTGIGRALDGLQNILNNDLADFVKTGICDAKDQQERDIELARLNADIQRYEAMPPPRPSSEPFVFTVGAEVGKLMEDLHPGSMAGWEKSKE